MSTRPRSLFEYLNNEEERPHLLAAIDGKLDDAGRLAYAQVLDHRDPLRAEWLRLDVQLHNQGTTDVDVHRRYMELGRQFGYELLRILRRKDVLNCGKGASEPRRVRFSFICDKRWETLLPTESPGERHCNACSSRVYQCSTVREAETHALAGHCIAVSSNLVNKASGRDYHAVVGRPNPVADWGDKLFPEQ
jgi:uncharacterized protein (TIGR02996 family)